MMDKSFSEFEEPLDDNDGDAYSAVKRRHFSDSGEGEGDVSSWVFDHDPDYYAYMEFERDQAIEELKQSKATIDTLRNEVSKLERIHQDERTDSDMYIDEIKRQITKLSNSNDALVESAEKGKRHHAGRLSAATRKHRKRLRRVIRSYAAKSGWALKWHKETEMALIEIRAHCRSGRFRNIDNLKARIHQICDAAIFFCTDCDRPFLDCDCKE